MDKTNLTTSALPSNDSNKIALRTYFMNMSDVSILSEEIGNRIRCAMSGYKLKTKQPMNQKILAEMMQLSKSKISGMIKGNRPPSIAQLVAVAEILNVSTDYLLGLDEYKIHIPFRFQDIQKLTGLSQLSINRLANLQKTLNPDYETDSIFHNYHINFDNMVTLKNNKRYPKAIFSYNYKHHCYDLFLDLLDIPDSIIKKLSSHKIKTIAEFLLYTEEGIKDAAQLSDKELNEVKREIKAQLDDKFGEKDVTPETGRVRSSQKKEYTNELYFINALIESGKIFESMEERVAEYYKNKSRVNSLIEKVKKINTDIESIERKYFKDETRMSEKDRSKIIELTERKEKLMEVKKKSERNIEYLTYCLNKDLNEVINEYFEESYKNS